MGGWPDQFFTSTPRIIAAVMEGRARAALSRRRLVGWHAHTAASLDRAKRIPSLDKLVEGPDVRRAPVVRREPQDLLSLARRWAAVVPKITSRPTGAAT